MGRLIPTSFAKVSGTGEIRIYLMLVNSTDFVVIRILNICRSTEVPLQLNPEELCDRRFINSPFHSKFSFLFSCFYHYFSFCSHLRKRL